MRVYLGIDWSESKHDAVFMNEAGAELAHITIPHSADGFQQLDALRQRLGVAASECWVGLETAHNMLIDFLWDKGYCHIMVIPPHVIKGNRGRQGASGAHTDRSDAWLIADTLRTDQPRLGQPWQPDSVLNRQIRAKVSLLLALSHDSLRLANRLRSLLLRYYPAAVVTFRELAAPVTLRFICAYPTPEAAAALSYAEFAVFVQAAGYPNPQKLPKAYARLRQAQPQAAGETVQAYQAEAVTLASLLLNLVEARQRELRAVRQLFWQHPDAPIFDSLPGAGDLLAPALLAKFGEDRQRFPRPTSVQALAGTCPVTEASGKRRVVKFRYACDREFRHIAQQWAWASLKESPYAVAYWERVRPHCRSDSHALRCLANRWLAIAWKLWQTGQTYDETYHMQQRTLRSQPRS